MLRTQEIIEEARQLPATPFSDHDLISLPFVGQPISRAICRERRSFFSA